MKKLFLFIFLIFIGISSENYATSQVGNSSQQKDNAIKDENDLKQNVKKPHIGEVEVISFEQRSTGLSEEAKSQVSSFVAAARKRGEVDEIKIAVWSDQESPVKANKDLPKDDRRLAEHRGDNLKDFLKYDLDIRKVEIYNMAEGTSWLAKMFNTEESELRSAFSLKGHKGKLRPEVALIHEYGKPSHAVLVIEQRKKE